MAGKSAIRTVNTVKELKSIREWKYFSEDVRIWMSKAYEALEQGRFQSDGISWISQLGFDRHPAGVMHDYLYRFAPMSRKAADQLFRQALEEMGYPNFGKLWYLGLRAGGWYAWYKCRLAEAV